MSRPSAMMPPGCPASTTRGPIGGGRRIASRMLNFVLGTLAGGLIACVLTIAAARQPEIQARLGLVAAAPPVTLAAASRPPEPDCAKPADAPRVGTQDMLFNRRRFWSVAP